MYTKVMEEQPDIEYVLGGIAAIHDELKEVNTLLRRLYDIEMTTLARHEPDTFDTINTVHNKLGMFMDDDWESKLL